MQALLLCGIHNIYTHTGAGSALISSKKKRMNELSTEMFRKTRRKILESHALRVPFFCQSSRDSLDENTGAVVWEHSTTDSQAMPQYVPSPSWWLLRRELEKERGEAIFWLSAVRGVDGYC